MKNDSQGINHSNLKTLSAPPGLKVCLLNPTSVCNKTSVIHDFVVTHCLDLLFITETWLTGTTYDEVIKTEILPPGYNVIHKPRSKIGGGTAIIHRSSVQINCYQTGSYESFEVLGAKIQSNNKHVLVFVVYRPPPSQANKLTFTKFKTEFTQFLEILIAKKTPFVIYGDFNFHVDNVKTNYEARTFVNLLDNFGVKQHVNGPTHTSGHTLDLILTLETDNLIGQTEAYDCAFHGHFPVFSSLLTDWKKHAEHTVTYRKTANINHEQFRGDVLDICQKYLHDTTDVKDVNFLVRKYNEDLSCVTEKHAPLRQRVIRSRNETPWYNTEIRSAKQQRRRLERLWRKTKLEVHRQMYKAQCNTVTKLIEQAKRDYYATLIQENENNSKTLFRIVNSLLGKSKQTTYPSSSGSCSAAERLGAFFEEKIERISVNFSRSQVTGTVELNEAETSSAIWTAFDAVTSDEVKKIVKESPKKSCSLDPIPTGLLGSCIDTVIPIITNIVNASLQSGIFPEEGKSALITPILKKPSLDAEVLGNYRPVSNLSFLSKVMEKVVAKRLRVYLEQHGYNENYQSAYREFHSTETALIKIKEDIVSAMGNRQAVLLVLLDLSAAFDTINHAKLLQILRKLGIGGVVLDWFTSYLTDRKQSIKCAGSVSSEFRLTTGVPQGSVLGPILFTAYTASLGKVLSKLGVEYHFYADDTQVYLSFDVAEEASTTKLMEKCILEIRDWMLEHSLKMNDDKTELMFIGNRGILSSLKRQNISVGDQVIRPKPHVKSLGVTFDEEMTFKRHVQNLCRSAYITIRSLSRIKQYLTPECLKTLVHAFITSKLDYCNSLYLGCPDYVISSLQSVQNATARLITGTRKYDHITPVLFNLHWLPVYQRIKFKVLLIIYKAKHGSSPSYITDLLRDHRPSRSLRSSDAGLLVIPFTRSTFLSERSFQIAGPRLWKKLPFYVRNSDTVDTFKTKLKTLLFKEHFDA